MSEEGTFLFYYNFAVIISAVYQAVFIPFELFFIEVDHLETGGLAQGHKLWVILERLQIVAEVFFYGDLILGFFTSYFDHSIGEFIWHPRKIVGHYLKHKFIVNMLATFHWGWFFRSVFRIPTSNPAAQKFFTIIKYLKLLKMQDIIHVMAILKSLNFKKETKALLFIVYYLILIFIWVHFFACLLWYFLRQAKTLKEVMPIWSFAFNFGSY